jgi:hypothetical protein
MKPLETKLGKVEAVLKKERATRDFIVKKREDNAYSRGVDHGAAAERAIHAAQEDERRRSIRGVPTSQKEAAPGIYFLQWPP